MLLLVVIAILVVLASWTAVSNATLGVAGICFACFILILARMAQAEKQHAQLLARLQPATPPIG